MNIVQIYKDFPNQAACIAHLEQVRWKGTPRCVHCASTRVGRHGECKQQNRWQCYDCKKSFSVTVGTIFHNTHVELQKWFLLITLMLNAKKGLSSYQAARDLQLNRPTAWSMMHRIRNAMKDDGTLLSGIIEMDETYIGGKPRTKNNKDDDDTQTPRGRGTRKIPVVGMIERNGKVKAKSTNGDKLNSYNLESLVRKNVAAASSVLVTDEYRGYAGMKKLLGHKTINHQRNFVDCMVHTNTIESFWAIVKRGIIGQYHKVSAKYLDKYLDEFCYRYNARFDPETVFSQTLFRMVG